MSARAARTDEDIIRTGSAHMNEDLVMRIRSMRTKDKPLASRTDSACANQDPCVTTSISSVGVNKDERGTMSISSVHTQEDLSISSQRSLREEKEEEHF